jgi:hypothetical protein
MTEPTSHAYEVLRRMEPMRWYFDSDLHLPTGVRGNTIQALETAGYLETSHISWLTNKNEVRTYTIIRKTKSPETTTPTPEEHETLRQLTEKYGKDTIQAMIAGESWQIPTHARSTVPPLTGQLAGNCFDHLLKPDLDSNSEQECPQPKKTSAAG